MSSSDDGQELADAILLVEKHGLESAAAKFEEAKERMGQKSREVGDDDHMHAEHSLTHSLTFIVCVCVWCPLWVAGTPSVHHGGRRTLRILRHRQVHGHRRRAERSFPLSQFGQ